MIIDSKHLKLETKGHDQMIDLTGDVTWGDGNGYSHLRASVIGPSLSIPIEDGKMMLGTWQQIVLIDHDVRPRSRQVVVQVIGEK